MRVVLVASALVLAACQASPLRGSAGVPLGVVAVEPVETRVAQRVRNGLIEELGVPEGGETYRLLIDVTNRVDLLLTDIAEDRTTAGAAVVTARYVLSRPDGRPVAEGREQTRASFDAPLQEFARQRAIRDAENRAAREAASRIRLAIAPALAGREQLADDVPPPPAREPVRPIIERGGAFPPAPGVTPERDPLVR